MLSTDPKLIQNKTWLFLKTDAQKSQNDHRNTELIFIYIKLKIYFWQIHVTNMRNGIFLWHKALGMFFCCCFLFFTIFFRDYQQWRHWINKMGTADNTFSHLCPLKACRTNWNLKENRLMYGSCILPVTKEVKFRLGSVVVFGKN